MDSTGSTATQIAAHPVLWLGAAAVLAVITLQSLVYLRAARRASKGAGMSADDFRAAFRAGGVSAIGPSLAICLVALALLPLFGTPSTITRIGLIGSAAYETLAANIALGTMGSQLGDPDVSASMLVTMLLALALGGSGWMIVTLIVTPLMRASPRNADRKRPRSARWAVIPVAALVGAFFTMTGVELSKGGAQIAVTATSAAVMLVILLTAKAVRRPALTEYALGIAMLSAITVGYLFF